ncbi:hypothetical protein M0P65_05545 [Candidatus Gracilibacteria bacterium]|nr:hypothetical protein [Candidatus Gracilibacteria bacterium]
MIGYKATRNGKCLDLLYEVGQTYTLDGELILCVRGFHFCQDLYSVFDYYPPNKNIKVFKVEALGNIKTDGDKSVTDKISILEEVSLSNLIVEKDGYKRCFDDKGNLIKQESSSGYWVKWVYDFNNNKIKYKNSNGDWEKREYNSNNNLIKKEYSSGDWAKYYYDENNRCIKYEESDGHWVEYEHDKNGNVFRREGYNLKIKK